MVVRIPLGLVLAFMLNVMLGGSPAHPQQGAPQNQPQTSSPQASPSQTGSPQQKPRDTFFAGALSECSTEKISVSRVVSGKTENRTFKLTEQTKIETAAGAKWDTGKLRVKQRVTVRYTTGEDGDVATLIVVRITQQKK